jgi:hypothetical protein
VQRIWGIPKALRPGKGPIYIFQPLILMQSGRSFACKGGNQDFAAW